jgi:hypothetical protein
MKKNLLKKGASSSNMEGDFFFENLISKLNLELNIIFLISY